MTFIVSTELNIFLLASITSNFPDFDIFQSTNFTSSEKSLDNPLISLFENKSKYVFNLIFKSDY